MVYIYPYVPQFISTLATITLWPSALQASREPVLQPYQHLKHRNGLNHHYFSFHIIVHMSYKLYIAIKPGRTQPIHTCNLASSHKSSSSCSGCPFSQASFPMACPGNWKHKESCEKWTDQHNTSVEQRKNPSSRQESNPWPPKRSAGALSTELRELMENKVI